MRKAMRLPPGAGGRGGNRGGTTSAAERGHDARMPRTVLRGDLGTEVDSSSTRGVTMVAATRRTAQTRPDLGPRDDHYASAMDLAYPPDAQEFRAEIRTWLEENLPEGWFDEGFSMTAEERAKFVTEWTEKLYKGGWICASWPTEYEGKGLSILQSVVLNEEFDRAGAPLRADFFGDTLVGPTILQWGSSA